MMYGMMLSLRIYIIYLCKSSDVNGGPLIGYNYYEVPCTVLLVYMKNKQLAMQPLYRIGGQLFFRFFVCFHCIIFFFASFTSAIIQQ